MAQQLEMMAQQGQMSQDIGLIASVLAAPAKPLTPRVFLDANNGANPTQLYCEAKPFAVGFPGTSRGRAGIALTRAQLCGTAKAQGVAYPFCGGRSAQGLSDTHGPVGTSGATYGCQAGDETWFAINYGGRNKNSPSGSMGTCAVFKSTPADGTQMVCKNGYWAKTGTAQYCNCQAQTADKVANQSAFATNGLQLNFETRAAQMMTCSASLECGVSQTGAKMLCMGGVCRP